MSFVLRPPIERCVFSVQIREDECGGATTVQPEKKLDFGMSHILVRARAILWSYSIYYTSGAQGS